MRSSDAKPQQPQYITMNIVNEIDNIDLLEILYMNIKMQFASIIRAQQIMHVENRFDTTKELKKLKVENVVSDEGQENQLPIEQEYESQFAWDKQATFMNSLSRSMAELRNKLKQYTRRLSPRELVGGYLTCKKYSKQNTTAGYAIYTAREYHALSPFINDVVIIVDVSGVTDQLEETVRSETFPFSIRIVPIGNRWIAEEKEQYENRVVNLSSAIAELPADLINPSLGNITADAKDTEKDYLDFITMRSKVSNTKSALWSAIVQHQVKEVNLLWWRFISSCKLLNLLI